MITYKQNLQLDFQADLDLSMLLWVGQAIVAIQKC